MNKLLRKVRGVLGIGLTWGALWALIGAALTVVIWIVDPDSVDPGEGPLNMGAIIGVVGFISGTFFGTVLAFAERRKTIRDLSVGRAALYGALGSLALPLLNAIPDGMILFTGPLSAVFAAASVAIARRAARGDPEEPGLLNAETVTEVRSSRDRERHTATPV